MPSPRASIIGRSWHHLDQELRATQRRAGTTGLSSRFCKRGGETLAAEVIPSLPSRLREMGLETLAFPSSCGSDGKRLPAVRDPGSIAGSGTSLGEGNGNPLQYSCLENPMDRRAW